MAVQVDVRGLSCPQPVMQTRRALQEAGVVEVTVLLDSMTQVDNCTRAAEALGWDAGYDEKGGEFVLTLRRRTVGASDK
jgi:tRNA 2-thiouridine synthesizing protein A